MNENEPGKTPGLVAAPEQEKNHGRDLELVAELPDRTQELSALMDASEKSSGKERVAATGRIRDKSD